MLFFQRRVQLPTTPEAFDRLVARVVKEYKLIDAHHAAAVISVAIRHLPHTEAYCTVKYLGDYVLKNLANYVADHKSQIMKHESQIDQLIALLKSNPNDNQARDGLEKAANEGSEYAKAELAKLPTLVEITGPLPETIVAG